MASGNQDLSDSKTSRMLRTSPTISETRGPLPKRKVPRQRGHQNKSAEASIKRHQRLVDDCATAKRDRVAPAPEGPNSTNTVKWNIWEDRPYCAIADAVALALGLLPGKTSKALKDVSPIGKSFRRLYKSVCLAVRVGIISSGPEPVPQTRDLRKLATHLVSLRSVIEFLEGSEHWRNVVPKEMVALKGKFPDCKGRHVDGTAGCAQSSGSDVARRKAPDKFVAALIELLAEIGRRAGSAGLSFSVTEMPGQKRDLYELARRFESTEKDAPLDREFSTFTTYVKGLCCFKQGAQATDMYSNLFPELLAKSNP
jgi:hypothetical protein